MNRYVLSVLLLLVNSTVLGQATKQASTDRLAAIPAAMQKFVDSGEISGAVTLVGRDGEIVHLAAVGHADLEAGRRMKKSSLFSIASMTKPVVATGVLILQDQGKLTVEDRVSKYIPEFATVQLKNGDPANREITIRDLLTHTSGLAGNQIFQGTLAEESLALANRPLAFQPGTKWQYSPGLNVAGRIIEVVSGKPLQTFLAEEVFQPLGMNDSTFFPPDDQIGRMATLYVVDPENKKLAATENFIVDVGSVAAPNPSGGLISSAADMFRFYQMVLDGGQWRGKRIVSVEAVQQMTTCRTGDLKTGFTPGNGWGLGWCIVREPQGVTRMLSTGTFGHGGAFGTQGWVDPGTRSIYVLMIQRHKLPNADASDMRDAFQSLAAPAD